MPRGSRLGRQVNFYMHPDDLAELQREIERRGDIAIYASGSSDRKPMELPSVVVTNYGGDDLTVYLARKGETASIVTKPAADHFWIAADESPVLEFSRS